MSTSTTKPADHTLPDVQGSQDPRRVAIDKVGVKGIRYPITLACPRTGGSQHTVAMVNMYVGLPHYQKGTHMSRFLEVLNAHHDELRINQIMSVCTDMKERLEAEEAHLELKFPYFIDKRAPVSGQVGKLDIDVTFEATTTAAGDDLVMGIKVPATSLCPCSKEISEYGAHNQRGEVTVAMAVSFKVVFSGPVVNLVYTVVLASAVFHDLLAPRILRGLLVDAVQLG